MTSRGARGESCTPPVRARTPTPNAVEKDKIIETQRQRVEEQHERTEAMRQRMKQLEELLRRQVPQQQQQQRQHQQPQQAVTQGSQELQCKEHVLQTAAARIIEQG